MEAVLDKLLAMTSTADQVVMVSAVALEKIIELRDNETDSESLGLRIEVTGSRGVDYTYDLAFQVLSEADDGDLLIESEGLTVVIPGDDAEKLQGSELDIPSHDGQSGLVLRNPNRPMSAPSDGPIELTGDIPTQVQQLLDARINPSIAAHGGWAELVTVEDDTVVVRLGGGCQGCGMAKATVTAGIEQTIIEHIPSITKVVDVTDHQSGENPYYAPA
jgi:Fe/S biogenesis protein NfuA